MYLKATLLTDDTTRLLKKLESDYEHFCVKRLVYLGPEQGLQMEIESEEKFYFVSFQSEKRPKPLHNYWELLFDIAKFWIRFAG